MSTLKERVNKYLANVSYTKIIREVGIQRADADPDAYEKFRESAAKRHERKSLEILEKRFRH
jgi:hypothetical protein